MNRNYYWLILLLIICCLAFWFIYKAGREIYAYYQLNVQKEAHIDRWSIKELKSDRFVVLAHYDFDYKGKSYQGEGQVGNFFPNPWAAQEAQKKFASRKWMVWLNSNDPAKSAIEKHFPLKKTLSALILIGLALYFLTFAIYLRFKNLSR
jgi:hypothetical protein